MKVHHYVCDRCTEKLPDGCPTLVELDIKVCAVCPEGTIYTRSEKRDLCKTCANSLDQWFERART